MLLRTFWIWRQDVDYPECVLACSQELVDEIPDTWNGVKEMALAAWPVVDGAHREIEVIVDDYAIEKHWYPDAVEGEVIN